MLSVNTKVNGRMTTCCMSSRFIVGSIQSHLSNRVSTTAKNNAPYNELSTNV